MGAGFSRLEWSSKILMTLANEWNFPQLYFIVTSFISISIFTYVMYKEAPDFKLSALFFYSFLIFYFTTMSFVRQGMACACIFLMMPFLLKREYLKAIFCIALGCFFHISAIVGVLAFAVYLKIWSRKSCFYFWLLTFLAGQLFLPVIQEIVSLIPDGGYTVIIKGKDFLTNTYKTNMKGYQSLFYAFNMICVFLLVNYPLFKKGGKKYEEYIWIFMIGMIILNLIHPFGGHAGYRTALFFFASLLVLVPFYINNNKLCAPWMSKSAFTLFCLFLMSYQLYLSHIGFHERGVKYNYYLPYRFFWEADEVNE